MVQHYIYLESESVKMGDNKWSEDEKEILQNLCGKFTHAEIARILNRSLSSVQQASIRLGLKNPRVKSNIDKIMRRVMISEHSFNETPCWIWTGKTSREGYGVISINNKRRRAHRYAWEYFNGVLKKELVIDHLCKNRNCVNILHLEPVPNTENVLRGNSPPAQNLRKTHCNNGHIFDEKNTWLDKHGYRHCRRCKYERMAKHPWKNKYVADIIS